MKKIFAQRQAFLPRRPVLLRSLCVISLLLALYSFDFAHAQTPSPTPGPKDERGIGLKTGDAARPAQSAQTKQLEAKPELILQTGYNNFFGATRSVFSPDGRLLATRTFGSSTTKLWETATGRELRNFSGGGTNTLNIASAVAFSRDGRLIAAAGGDNTVKIWEVGTGREIQSLVGQQGAIMASVGVSFIAFSADARTLVTVSDAIRIWDVNGGRELRALSMDAPNTSGLYGGDGGFALSPDGAQLAAVVSDGSHTEVRFSELSTGRTLRSIKFSDDMIEGAELTFTAGGKLFVAGIVEQRLLVWDVNAKGKGRVLGQTSRDFPNVKFSRDGRLLALCEGYVVRLWEPATGRELPSLKVPNGGRFPEQGAVFVSFSEDGRTLATGGFDTQTLLWDVETGKQVRAMSGNSNMAYKAAFSPDGNFLYSGGDTRWDLRTGRGLRVGPSSRDEKLIGFPSQDGRLLAAYAANTNAVKIFDLTTGRELHTLAAQSSAVTIQNALFSPDARLLATTYVKSYTQQSAQDSKQQSQPQIDKDALMKAAKDAMKGGQINPAAIAQMMNQSMKSQMSDQIENQVTIWDASSGRVLRTITADELPMQVAFSSDGRVLVTTGMNNQPTLWDVASGARLHSLSLSPSQTQTLQMKGSVPGMDMSAMLSMMNDSLASLSAGTMGRKISSVAFSPDGRFIAAGGFDSKSNFDPAAIMAAATSKSKKPIDPQDMMKDIRIETAGRVTLWDAASGREVATLRGHSKGVTQVAFSRDGRLLASSGSDNTIKIWDVSTGRELKNLVGHTANVNSIDFSPNANLLASAADDGSTLLWDVSTGERLATLASLGDGSEWIVVTPDGLFDGSPASWNQILWRYNSDTFNVAPIEWFFNEFYHPGLLSEIFMGKRPRAAQDVSQKDRRQPQLKLSLAEGQADAAISTRAVKLKIEVSEASADAENRQGSGARDVRLFRNGSLVRVWRGDVLKGQRAVTLETSIPVVAGQNRLVAYAFNQDNGKSKDAPLTISGANTLKRAGTAYILAVGINEYANSQYNLRYAVADAREFAAEVRRQQSHLSQFERVEIIPLLDSDATKSNILAVLKRLSGEVGAPSLKAGVNQTIQRLEAAQPEDAVIIYFAGHGTASGQRFYLIPHDLGYADNRESIDERGLRTMLSHSISDEELEQAVERIDAGHLLLVIDACNSGQALEAEEKRRGPMNSKGLAQLAYEKGMYVLTAAQSYQAALEAAQLGHGLLTYALVEEGLKTGNADGKPKDGLLNAREWLDFATERVPQLQEEKMKQEGARGLTITFTHGEQTIADPSKRTLQRPRVFYRRELEVSPFVVAVPQPGQ